ncbi:heterokaryon incompatibility protein-domain-containing protein [Nemania sp. NC0429]|nr:heterokaryon incompatibility protein-domain-containing protein [Nemania sp. NC0429]
MQEQVGPVQDQALSRPDSRDRQDSGSAPGDHKLKPFGDVRQRDSADRGVHDGETIRLLKLQPGQNEDPIVVHLRQCRLDRAEPYEALSYVWGNPLDTASITLLEDGDRAPSEQRVTRNCYAALRRLRKPTLPRTLWIDAICIDQKSDNERTSQLPLIPQIYSQASQVLIHLGQTTPKIDVALDYIRALGEPASVYAIHSTERESIGDSLKALFAMPWFHRIWVLQEIHFSKSAIVISGDREIDWEHFSSLKAWNESRYYANRDNLPFSVQWLTGIQTRSRSWRGTLATFPQRLLQMLSESRACGATDPRDKLFAILPLIDGWHDGSTQTAQSKQARLSISSEQSEDDTNIPSLLSEEVPVEANHGVSIDRQYHTATAIVFTNLAEDLIETFGLSVLSHSTGLSSLTKNLPSWVPDWSTERQYNPLRGGRTHSGEIDVYLNPFYPSDWLLSQAARSSTKSWRFSTFESTTETSPTAPSQTTEAPRRQLYSPAIIIGRIAKIGPIADIEKDYLPLGIWQSLVLGRDDLLAPVYKLCAPTPHHDCHPDCLKAQVPVFVRTLFGDLNRNPQMVREALLDVRIRNSNREGGKGYRNHDYVEDSKLWDFLREIPLKEKESADVVSPPSESAGLYNLYKFVGPSPGYYIRRLFSMCHGSRFFVLEGERGGIGLAQWNAEVGDEVVKLEDSSDVFVVRDKVVDHVDGSESNNAGAKIVEFVGKGFVSRLQDLVEELGSENKVELVIR